MATVDHATQSDMSDIERRFCREVRDLERKCEVLEAEHEVAKAQASIAKKKLDEAVASLRATIRRGPSTQTELLFASEGWGKTPIEHALTLSGKQLEILREADVATVDDFEALRAGKIQGYPRGLLDLPRVGQATVDKWEDEILDWIGRKEQESNTVANETDGDE
jgi:hypothetical protein